MKNLFLSINNQTININKKQLEKQLTKQKNKCCYCDIKINENNSFNIKSGSACELCYYTLNLQLLTEKNQGSIILLPEIKQEDLINLVRSIYYIKSLNNKYKEDKESIDLIYQELIERAELANHYYSTSISNPFIITQLLLSLDKENYDKREIGLYGLKWMPNINEFPQHKNDIYPELEKFHPDNWKKIIKSIKRKSKA